MIVAVAEHGMSQSGRNSDSSRKISRASPNVYKCVGGVGEALGRSTAPCGMVGPGLFCLGQKVSGMNDYHDGFRDYGLIVVIVYSRILNIHKQ